MKSINEINEMCILYNLQAVINDGKIVCYEEIYNG
jgi:hypothetical protein